jgi:hypothetical protein
MLTTIAYFKSEGRCPLLLVELPHVGQFSPDEAGMAHSARGMRYLSRELDKAARYPEPDRTRRLNRVIDAWCTPERLYPLACTLAARMGCEVGGCDPVHESAESIQMREEKIVETLIRATRSGRPVVAMVGAVHIAPILQHCNFTATFGITSLPSKEELRLGRERQRFIGVIEDRSVLKYRSSGTLEKAPLAAHLEAELGVMFEAPALRT